MTKRAKPTETNIVVVDDERSARLGLVELLRDEGYAVRGAGDGFKALGLIEESVPDLLITDVHMPGMDGITLMQKVHETYPHMGVIVMTAHSTVERAVEAMRLGADDYLTKDVSLPHLLARIAALFRRVDAQGSEAGAEDLVERGPLRLDLKRVIASWRDRRLDLTLTEFWIVHALARHPGHVKNREQLMGEARMVVDDSTITSHVKRIRKKLAAVDPGFDRIESVYGMGYRWRED